MSNRINECRSNYILMGILRGTSTTGLDRALELKTLRNMQPYFTSIATKQHGWGHMDPGVWADLSSAYVALEQMPREVKPEEIMTNEVVEMAKTPKV
jgi:hypothetical protein